MKIQVSLLRLSVPVIIVSFLLAGCKKDVTGNTTQDPVITEKGLPVGDPASATIDQDGGQLISLDGKIRLIVPAGALSASTNISIQPVTGTAPLGLGTGYRLLPEGQTFLKPVTLTFAYSQSVLRNTPEDFLWIVTQSADGSWNALLKSALDRITHTVSCETTHFSDWALARFIDLELSPVSTTIKKGQSVQLKLSGFVRDKSVTEDTELAPLVPITTNEDVLTPLTPIPPVESRLMDMRVKVWSMNGTAAPVSNNNGSLSGSGHSATYTAPNQKPATNPVAVSATLETTDKAGRKSSFSMVSNITVTDADLYLSLTVDGQNYTYYQVGFNGIIPDDPNHFFQVFCGLSNGALEIDASEIMVNVMPRNVLTFVFDKPSTATRALDCTETYGKDDMSFALVNGGTGDYIYTYEKRTPDGTGGCINESACGTMTVKLTAYTGALMSVVTGTFNGTLYEDQPGYQQQCKMADAHTVIGEFRLVLAGI